MSPPQSQPLLQSVPPSRPVPSELRGYLYMFISSIFFSIVSLLVHYLSTHTPLTAINCYFIRSLLELALALIYLFTLPPSSRVVAPRYRLHLLLRAVLGAAGMALIFQALQHLPVGPAMSLFFLNPILTLFFSSCLIQEPLTRPHFLAAALSFTGILLISTPGSLSLPSANAHPILGLFYALSSAVLVSLAYVTARHLGFNVHFIVSVLMLGLFSLLVSILLGGAMTVADILRLKAYVIPAVVAAIFAVLGQSFVNMGFQHCRAAPGALIRTVDVPLAYLLGLVFVAEQPTWQSALGGALVFIATAIVPLAHIYVDKANESAAATTDLAMPPVEA